MVDQLGPSQQDPRHDRGHAPDGESAPGGQRLPDIPKVVNWATVLLILGAIPLLLMFVDNVFSKSVVVPGVDFPENSYGAMLLLTIGFIMLAVSVLNGRRRTRLAIAAVTVVFDFTILCAIVGLGRHFGPVGKSQVDVVNAAVLLIFVWAVILSSAGLALLYTPASNTYIARSEAYKTYIDQQGAGRSTQ